MLLFPIFEMEASRLQEKEDKLKTLFWGCNNIVVFGMLW